MACGAIYLLGIFTGSILFKPKPQPPPQVIIKPETTWVTLIDTLRLVSKDTVIIIAGSPPITTKKITIKDSLYFGVNGVKYYTPFSVGLLTDTLYGYIFTYKPGEVTTATPKGYRPSIFYGGLAFSIDTKQNLQSELELGMRIGRAGLFGRAEAKQIDSNVETVARLGFRVSF